ncbi:MAG: hypothetical protein IT436_15905 [Phycisphaerales bacterium]|nr:hypothetical protein [Phycisphaerales bacterium]
MNIPTGEVYIAPIENKSEGSVVINGSTDHIVFAPHDHVILSFGRGRLDLSKSVFSNTPGAQSFRTDLSKEARRNSKSMHLCELGIGINPIVTKLSGDEILDEKAAGTTHVALGANKPFGGKLDGTYHRDMILIPTWMRVDDREVVLPRASALIKRTLR